MQRPRRVALRGRMASPSLFVDPTMPALAATASRAEVRAFLVRVEEYAGLLMAAKANPWIAEEVVGALVAEDLYPTVDRVRRLVAMVDDVWCGAGDVSRWITSLLSRARRIEERWDFVHESLAVDPALGCEDSGLQLAHERSLVGAALHRREIGAAFVATGLDVEARAAVRVDVVLQRSGGLETMHVSEIVPVSSSSAWYWTSICPDEYWEEEPQFAVKVEAVQQWLSTGGCVATVPQSVYSFTIAEALSAQVARVGIASNPGYLRSFLATCGQALLSTHLAQVHHLRTGPGGGAPPRRRSDGAVAWRRDVTRGYHLHYWKQGDHVCLAWVGHHDDFACPDG